MEVASQPRSRSNSATSSLGIVPFGFHAKTNYDANESLIQFRSDSHKRQPIPKDNDIWKRPPPDFRLQEYRPDPPKRNSREAVQPWMWGTIPGKREIIRRDRSGAVPHVLKPEVEELPDFETSGHMMRPFTAKRKFVTEGMNKAGAYHNPKHHDFRGYPPIKTMGLPEFETKYDRDPFSIKFLTDRLNTIHGAKVDVAAARDITGRQMYRSKTPLKPWDRGLIMDSDKWPTKSGAYTRYRRRHRDPHSAFMERVDETLHFKWARERMEQELAKYYSEQYPS